MLKEVLALRQWCYKCLRKELLFFLNKLFNLLICLKLYLENVALNKSAWQQNTVFNYAAKRGVDGRKSSLKRYGDECVTSEYKATSEWRVDLEHVLSIHHISILFATDDKDWSMIVVLYIRFSEIVFFLICSTDNLINVDTIS